MTRSQYHAELMHACSYRWEALLVVADGSQFANLPRIVGSVADARVWVYAELIGDEFKARDAGTWRPDYHGTT